MKNLAYTLALVFFTFTASFAQRAETAEQKANSLSDKMIRELQLNNYQSRKVREINLEKANQMVMFETKFLGNKEELERCFMGVCKERDQELEGLLSTTQYSQYYSVRKNLNAYAKELTFKVQKDNAKVAKTLVAQDETDAKRTFPKTETAVLKEADSKKK